MKRKVDDCDFASALMYPKVFADFVAAQDQYGPVWALPTHTFFYGMIPGEEISVDIEAGKTLVFHLQAIGEPEDDGQVRLFFELNGQPRTVAVPNRTAGATPRVRRTADEAEETQLGAPMPGLVTRVLVSEGDVVKAGNVLMTLEAMKMETSITAPFDGTVSSMLVKPGQQVDAKELLMTLEKEANRLAL